MLARKKWVVLLGLCLCLWCVFAYRRPSHAQGDIGITIYDVQVVPNQANSGVDLNVLFGITNVLGAPVSNVTISNASVIFDSSGAPVPITYARPTSKIYLALVLDVSQNSSITMTAMRQAAQNFIQSADPQTDIAIVTFSDVVVVPHSFNTNRQDLLKDIAGLKPSAKAGSCFYDGVNKALDMLQPPDSRRRAVVVFTGNKDIRPDGSPCSTHDLLGVVNYAAKSSPKIPIYAIGLQGGYGLIDVNALTKMAQGTGGSVVFGATSPNKPLDLTASFNQIQSNLNSQWLATLTIFPTQGHHTVTFNATVAVGGQTLNLSELTGFDVARNYAPTPTPLRVAALVKAVRLSDDGRGLTIDIEPPPITSQVGGYRISFEETRTHLTRFTTDIKVPPYIQTSVDVAGKLVAGADYVITFSTLDLAGNVVGVTETPFTYLPPTPTPTTAPTATPAPSATKLPTATPTEIAVTLLLNGIVDQQDKSQLVLNLTVQGKEKVAAFQAYVNSKPTGLQAAAPLKKPAPPYDALVISYGDLAAGEYEVRVDALDAQDRVLVSSSRTFTHILPTPLPTSLLIQEILPDAAGQQFTLKLNATNPTPIAFYQVTFTDSAGTLLPATSLNAPPYNQLVVPTTNLKPGKYFVEVTAQDLNRKTLATSGRYFLYQPPSQELDLIPVLGLLALGIAGLLILFTVGSRFIRQQSPSNRAVVIPAVREPLLIDAGQRGSGPTTRTLRPNASLKVQAVRPNITNLVMGQEFSIEKMPFIIGRSNALTPGYGIAISDVHNEISREHATIYFKDRRYYLRASDNEQGTFVNGNPVSQETPLSDGAEIKIGTSLTLRFATAPDPNPERDDRTIPPSA